MPYGAGMIDRKKIARLVRMHRARLGISQTDLAKMAKLGIATVKRIEAGTSGSLETLAAIARALGVDLGELAGMPTGRSSVAALLDQWVEGERIRPRLDPPPTEEEIAWLRNLPSIFWTELPPTEQTLENLVRARRSARSFT